MTIEKLKISHKRKEIDPNCETFGKYDYKKLAELMNWYTGDDKIYIKKILVNVEVLYEELDKEVKE